MTGESLHSGVRNELSKEYESFKELPFPEPPESDELYDIFSELVEYDGYVAGLISSFLKGNIPNRGSIEVGSNLELKLDSYFTNSDEESRCLLEYRAYKGRLDLLLELLRRRL
jgi:hypothetical protein